MQANLVSGAMSEMDPNKRGNPPFEPSSYAAGLERRVKRLMEGGALYRDHLRVALAADRGSAEYAATKEWFDRLEREQVVLSAPPAKQTAA